MPRKTTLSKTSYIKGLQCLKYLYLYKKHYNLRDKFSPEKLSKFKRGHEIGHLAQSLFPSGVNLEPASHFQYNKAIENTKRAIAKETPVIYEAAFKHNDVLIFLDILVCEDGQFNAYEVKSSLGISQTYLNDAALQYYILRGCGLNIADFSLVTINENYKRQGSIDVKKFFKIESVLEPCKAMQEEVDSAIVSQKAALMADTIPQIEVGAHCFAPYHCDFIGYCWKNQKKKASIFDLGFLSTDEKLQLHKQGCDLQDLLKSTDIAALQKRTVKCLIDKTSYTDTKALEENLWPLKNNACFLEILEHKPALPLFDGDKPYTSFPFLIAALPYKNENDRPFYYFLENSHQQRTGFLDFLTELSTMFSSVIVYDKEHTIEAVASLVKKTGYSATAMASFYEKLFGLKTILDRGYFISYKLGNTETQESVLESLGKKNPFPSKGKPNNIYDVRHLFADYLLSHESEKKAHLKELIINYGGERNKYLQRLYDYFLSLI